MQEECPSAKFSMVDGSKASAGHPAWYRDWAGRTGTWMSLIITTCMGLDLADELLRLLNAAGFSVVGRPRFARYDPPWTPWFLRRNEVVIPVP